MIKITGRIENEKLLKRILLNVLEGLNYLHENEIIHGDIKSANILIDEENDEFVFKLTDFGTSKNLSTVQKNIETEKKSLKG